jgi:hypothetical protein
VGLALLLLLLLLLPRGPFLLAPHLCCSVACWTLITWSVELCNSEPFKWQLPVLLLLLLLLPQLQALAPALAHSVALST